MKFFALLGMLFTFFNLFAIVTLPGIFSNHAVLAKRNNVPIWGMATPGEKIILSFNGKNYSTIANNSGRWMIKMNLAKTNIGPHILKVNDLIIKDILVGEVFLASGQSNMAFKLNRAEHFNREKQLPPNTYLRFFNTIRSSAESEQFNIAGKWEIVSPDTIKDCSAVAYFFAKKIQQTIKQPVGIINSSVGGTEIECWMSKQSILKFPLAVKKGKQREYFYKNYSQIYNSFLTKNRIWERQFNRIDNYPSLPQGNVVWQKVQVPVAFGNGIYFLKTNVNISKKDANNGFSINLLRCYTPMELYIDGKRWAYTTDETAYKQEYFRCNIPKKKLSPGSHEIIIRYFVSHNRVRIPQVAYFGNTPVAENQWQIFCGKNFGVQKGECQKKCPKRPPLKISQNRLWSYLFNGMIYPLKLYKLSGIIWYQGESNHQDAENYSKYFKELILDWRNHFDEKNLPFFFCQ